MIKLPKSVDKTTLAEVFETSIQWFSENPYENDDGTTEQDYIDEIKEIAKEFGFKFKGNKMSVK